MKTNIAMELALGIIIKNEKDRNSSFDWLQTIKYKQRK